MLTSSDDSDISSSYSSDGEIPCSHTKFKIETDDILKFEDGESFVCFPEKDEIRELDTINLKKNGNCVVIPSSVQKILNKSVQKRITSLRCEQKTVVYIKSPLLTFTDEELLVPRNVICDAFIFPSTGPVSVLTFVNENSDGAVSYNSTLARHLTVNVRKQTGSDFWPVHGTVTKANWDTRDSFIELVKDYKENAAKIAIPFSMKMKEESLKKVLMIFGPMFAELRLSSFQSDLFGRFVVTNGYKQVKEQLVKNKLLILTGAPGEGKSTIGKKLCYDYQQRGFNTVFCSGQQSIDWEAVKDMNQTLVVCDNVEDYVDLTRLENIISTCTVVIIMQTYDMKFSLLNGGITGKVVDITDIRRQAESTKDEYLQILKVSLGDTEECVLKDIVSNIPQCVGFPKVVSHYQMINVSGDPVRYFKYPLSFFQSEIEKLSRKSKLECFLYLLLCGGRMTESRKAEQKRVLKVLQSKFTYIWEEYVVKRLQCFIGSFFDRKGDTVSFSHQVIYDACLIVLDTTFPGFLWRHCKVQFDNGESLPEQLPPLEPLTIFISKQSNALLLEKLARDIQNGQIQGTLAHGILKSKDNVDTFLTKLAGHLEEVSHHQKEFLFWVVDSFNEYLCQKVLEREEIRQVDIDYVLNNLTAPKRRKYFLFLKEHLKGMQRTDICYSADVQDTEGNTLLMKALELENEELAEILMKDSNHLDIENRNGNTALHVSSHTGNLKFTKLLLSMMDKAKDKTGEHMRTPIMIAALKNHRELFKYLDKELKCDLGGVDDYGNTLLHLACVGGNVEIVKRLVRSKRFDLKQRGHYGRTLLMTTASWRNRDLFVWLLEQNCQVTSEDFDIGYLLSSGHVDHFRMITQFLQVRCCGQLDRSFKWPKTRKESSLKTYLDDKLTMKLVDKRGTSLLHQAAITGHVNLAELLLSNVKVDINITDSTGLTPVMLAAKKAKKEMFDFLISKKCDLSLKDHKGSTIIHFACCGGNMAIFKTLIDIKTDLNSINKLGEAPISLAVKHGEDDMVSTLIAEGCDMTVVDQDGNTLLHLASKKGDTTILEHLLSMKLYMYLNALNIDMQTPLLVATYNGHTELSRRLISCGARIDLKDYEGNNVLLVAAKQGNEEMFKYVIDQVVSVSHTKVKDEDITSDTVDIGHQSVVQQQMLPTFKIEDTDNRGNNMLHAGCFGGSIKIVSQLLDLKPDIAKENGMGKTAVMIAAEQGHTDVFDLLVMNGCDLAGTDKSKRTILHSACHGGSIEIVKKILKKEIVDINSADNNGDTPLITAADKGHGEVFSLLVKEGCNYSLVDHVEHNVLHMACKGGNSSIVSHILHEEMIDVNLVDQQGKTALFMAAETGNKEIFNLLSKKVVDMKVTDEDGSTILHAACRGGNADIVQCILSHDICDINNKNLKNKTPVMDSAEKGHTAVFALLKDNDCKLTTVAGDKSTILHAACRGGSTEIVQLLLIQKIVVDINSRDSRGRTSVLEAADKGHRAVFDLMVKEGCDLKISSRDNYTILHAACHGGSMAIVRNLLSREVADINSTWYGTTPAGMARDYGHHAISELLKNISPNTAKDNCKDAN